jgi:hypothetical protein
MNKSSSLFRHLLFAIVMACAAGTVAAKLPVAPETPESKAKAEEAAAKAAAAAKEAAADRDRYMDKAVANHKEQKK